MYNCIINKIIKIICNKEREFLFRPNKKIKIKEISPSWNIGAGTSTFDR